MPTRHTHKWDGLHTRHLLESTHKTQERFYVREAEWQEKRRGGEEEKRRGGEGEKRRRGEEEKRSQRRGEEEKRRGGEEEKRRRGVEEKRRRGEEEKKRKRRRGEEKRRRGGGEVGDEEGGAEGGKFFAIHMLYTREPPHTDPWTTNGHTSGGPYTSTKSVSAQCAMDVGRVCDTTQANEWQYTSVRGALCGVAPHAQASLLHTRLGDAAAGAATAPSAPYTRGRGRVPRWCALAVPAPHCHLVGSEVGGGVCIGG